MMTEAELKNLVACYILIEGYTDTRSIYNVLSQEYSGQLDPKTALEVIRKTLKEESEDSDLTVTLTMEDVRWKM